MPSTYSPSLRLELIGAGEQSGTWGSTTNTNLGTLLEQSITGVQSIPMLDANYILSNYNGVSDEARKAVLVVTGTLTEARDVIAPLVSKVYIVKNSTTGGFAINVRASSGLSVAVPNGSYSTVYCDGVNFYIITGGVTSISAGTGISLTGSLSVPIINNSGVNSITAGTGITIGGTSTEPTVTNSGVTSVIAGTGISLGGTANAPIINASGVAGVSTFSGGFTGLTPSSASTGAITLAGTLNPANGGTGSAGTLTGVIYGNGTSTYSVSTGAQIVSAIGTSAVANATNATSAASVTNGVYKNISNTFTAVQYIGSTSPNSAYGSYIRTASPTNATLTVSHDNTTGGNITMNISTNSTSATLCNFVYGDSLGGTPVSKGTITYLGGTVNYNTTSDYRLKENVVPITNSISRIKNLRPIRYTWVDNPTYPAVDGFLAHELAEVVPSATVGEKDAVDEKGNPKYQGIDQSKIVPLLTAALQEAIARIEVLEARYGI